MKIGLRVLPSETITKFKEAWVQCEMQSCSTDSTEIHFSCRQVPFGILFPKGNKTIISYNLRRYTHEKMDCIGSGKPDTPFPLQLCGTGRRKQCRCFFRNAGWKHAGKWAGTTVKRRFGNRCFVPQYRKTKSRKLQCPALCSIRWSLTRLHEPGLVFPRP